MKTTYVIEIEYFEDGSSGSRTLKVYLDNSDKIKEYRVTRFMENYSRDLDTLSMDIDITLSATNLPKGFYN